MAKDNKTMYAILGMLAHEDMTGYDIKKKIENSLSFFWDAGFGQIYPALNNLENEGYVTKRTEVVEKRPKRIIYSITGEGRTELEKWLAAPVEKEYVKYEILLKLFFGRLLPMGENIRKIEEFRTRSGESLRIMQEFKKNLQGVLGESEDHVYYYLTVLFGEKLYNAYLEWSEEAVAFLRQAGEDSTGGEVSDHKS